MFAGYQHWRVGRAHRCCISGVMLASIDSLHSERSFASPRPEDLWLDLNCFICSPLLARATSSAYTLVAADPLRIAAHRPRRGVQTLPRMAAPADNGTSGSDTEYTVSCACCALVCGADDVACAAAGARDQESPDSRAAASVRGSFSRFALSVFSARYRAAAQVAWAGYDETTFERKLRSSASRCSLDLVQRRPRSGTRRVCHMPSCACVSH